MKTLLDILDATFADKLDDYSTKYIGDKVYIKLDDKRRIELSWHNTVARDKYDAIKMELFNIDVGSIHRQIVKFEDIFYTMNDASNPNFHKHIWRCDGDYSWYGIPTGQDLEALCDTLVNYIEVWK